MTTQISIVDIIIDRPRYRNLRTVFETLKRATLAGHRVLDVIVTDPRDHDIVNIPHAGHSSACEQHVDECVPDEQYIRNFNVALIVEGAFLIGDHRYADYRYLHDTMIMVSSARVVPVVEDVERFTLHPWKEGEDA